MDSDDAPTAGQPVLPLETMSSGHDDQPAADAEGAVRPPTPQHECARLVIHRSTEATTAPRQAMVSLTGIAVSGGESSLVSYDRFVNGVTQPPQGRPRCLTPSTLGQMRD